MRLRPWGALKSLGVAVIAILRPGRHLLWLMMAQERGDEQDGRDNEQHPASTSYLIAADHPWGHEPLLLTLAATILAQTIRDPEHVGDQRDA